MDVTSTTGIRYRTGGSPLGAERVGEILGAWQPVEVRLAQSFAECRGLSREQVEDLYQETVIALLARPYASEAHLRNALRQGVRHRALNMHRDVRRRGQIMAEHAPSMHRLAEASAAGSSPESMALQGENRGVVLEFLAELCPFERQVFELTAEGLRYRAIAKRLGVDVNEARRAARSVERKRVLFRMRHELDWEPHPHARSTLLVAPPLPVLAAALGTGRRWLFGTGVSGKAAAAAASVGVLAAGASGLIGAHSGAPASQRHRAALSRAPGLPPATKSAALRPGRSVARHRAEGTAGVLRAREATDRVVYGSLRPTPGSTSRTAGAGVEFGFESR